MNFPSKFYQPHPFYGKSWGWARVFSLYLGSSKLEQLLKALDFKYWLLWLIIGILRLYAKFQSLKLSWCCNTYWAILSFLDGLDNSDHLCIFSFKTIFFLLNFGPRLTPASQPRWINPTIFFCFFVETFPYGNVK